MPARTLSPLVAADRSSMSPPRYAMHSPSSSYARRRRDSLHQDDVQPSAFHLPDYHVGPDALGRLHPAAMHTHFVHDPMATAGYVHAIPMQRQWPAFPIPSLPHPLAHASQPPAVSGWLPHPPNLTRLASPQILHKVWIIDCQSCGMFLTNRGMKAVLLLRPHVPLYSTDALPVNCSAQSMTATSSTSSAAASTQRRGSDASSTGAPEHTERISAASRTCECLTQTLWCHGCGASVGYMIVVPCIRCTSSTAASSRTTNGHRFVFYSSEIVASERYHVQGESGIISPAFSPRVQSSSRPVNSSNDTPAAQPAHEQTRILVSPRPPTTPNRRRHTSASLLDSPVQRHVQELTASLDHLTSPPPLSPATPPAGRTRSSSYSVTNMQEFDYLKPGDVLYWHHLIRHGEIPAVEDDPLSRNPQSSSPEIATQPVHGLSSKAKSDIQAASTRKKIAPIAGR